MIFISCEQYDGETLSNQGLQKSGANYELSPEDQILVVQNAQLDMISFVESIDEFYVDGDSFENLKHKLSPDNGLNEMDPVAENLLLKAYEHLSSGDSDEELTGIEIMQFFHEMLTNAQIDGANTLEEINLEDESVRLWGDDVENFAKKKCKWYQIGCHISNAWNWLNKKPGNGGQTNLQMIGTALSAIVAIIAIIAVLDGDSD